MKYRIYITIIAVFILSGCGLLSEIFTQNENTRIQESFTGIDNDLWDEFVRLSNLPNCQLPCWWGLELGEVELSEVLTFIEEREFDRYQERQAIDDTPPEVWIRSNGYSLEFTGRGTSDIGDVDYYFSFDDDNILGSINLTMRSPERWLIDENNPFLISTILSDIDIMPTVLISPAETSRVSDFSLFLIYPDEGLQIHYFMDISDHYPLVCLNSRNVKVAILDITNFPSSLIDVSDTSFIPIEGSWLVQGSSITTEEFVQAFRDNLDSCLDLSQYPQGE